MAIIITNELAPIETPKLLAPGDHRKDCCKIVENLEYYEVLPGTTCYRCKRCGCRHFNLEAQALQMGLKVIE